MAASIELAKAYVQIVPSAEGIQAALQAALGGLPQEGERQGQKTGRSFAAKFASVASRAITAAGLGKALAASLNEGGALQQSLGGVETLFRSSADTVKAYAADAWQSAGLSANDYMQNVSGFAAALRASFDGSEEAVSAAMAESANQAMVDMADNANKMGTAMESIQMAYQGFAKQNYTLLDNLKIGYGGTKAEMERLLADAQELSGVKYDIGNLADVYDAIHVIQQELGITGTTALEASTTLSGSFAAMGAAAQNLLGNLALGEDLQPSLDALGESVHTWLADNLLPMVGNILKGLPQIAGAVLEEMAEQVPVLQPLVNILGFLGEHMDVLAVAATAAAGAMAAYKAQLAVSGIVSAATKALNGMTVAQWASKAAQDALNGAMKANPIGIVVTLLGGLAAALVTAYNTSESFRNKVNAAFTAVHNVVMPVINTLKSALDGLKSAISGAISGVKAFLGMEDSSSGGMSASLGEDMDLIADKAEANALRMENVRKAAQKALTDSVTRTTGGVTGLSGAAEAASKVAASVVESVSDTLTQTVDGVTTTTETIREILSDGTTQQRKIITTTSQEMVDGVLKDVKTVETIAADGTSTIVTEMTEAEKVLLTTSDAVKAAMDALGDSFAYTADEAQLQADRLAVLQAAEQAAQDDVQRMSYLFAQSARETGAASEQTQYLSAQLDKARDTLRSAQEALQDYQKQLDKSAAAQDKFKKSAKDALSALDGFGGSLREMGGLLGSDLIAGLGDILTDMTGGVNTVLNFAASLATLTETLTTLKEAMNALKASEGVAGVLSGLGSMLGLGTAGAATGTAAAGEAAAAGAAAAGGTGILAVIGEALSGPVGWALLAAGAVGAIGLGISAALKKNRESGSAAQAVSSAVNYRDIQDAYWYGNERAFAGYDFRTDPYTFNPQNTALSRYQQQMQAQLARLTAVVQEYLPQTANMQMVLDDGTLVGALTPGINTQLGQLEMLAERGNV